MALYASAFLLGGVFTWLQPYVRAGSLFFGVSSRKLLSGDWNLEILLYLQRMNKYQYTVTVYTSGESCTIHALLDYRKQPVRSGYGEAGLHFRKETGRGNSKRKGTSDTALYPVLFSWNRERGTSGNQSRKNVHSYRAGVLGGKAAHWNL